MARKKSLKNGKHLVDLLESATLPAIRLLSSIDKFSFLDRPGSGLSDAEARADLIAFLPEIEPLALAISDQEAVRVLDLARFRAEHLLARAYDRLEFEEHPELASYDPSADVITRLIWLRAKASRIFDQVETLYLTHHFHGHAKFHSFGVRGGEQQDFTWSIEVEAQLHAAVSEVLTLSDEEKASCEIIHFEMAEGDGQDAQKLHYLVVYHPGKMRTLRQMVRGRRDLLAFVPALEATLVYDPAANKVHVLSDRAKVAKDLADRFSQIGFEKPLSKEPMDAIAYELSMFRSPFDLRREAKAPGVSVEDAWVSTLTVSLGHTRHSLIFELANSDDIWNLAASQFGEHNPIANCRAIEEIKLSFSVRFDGDEAPRALDITVGQRGTSNLLSLRDPKLRRCGEALLSSLGVMRRIEPVPVGSDLDLFQAELKLLDLMSSEVDGYLLSELQLSASKLLEQGMLTQKDFGNHIVIKVDDEAEQPVYRRLEVQSNSRRTWACDDVTGEEYELGEGDLRRYGIQKAYLRERLATLLAGQLTNTPLSVDEAEPFYLGDYVLGGERVPIHLVTGLWHDKHTGKMDLEVRRQNLGVGVVLTTTPVVARRFLGSSIVAPIDALLDKSLPAVHIDLSRLAGELRRWHGPAATAEMPKLLKDSNNSAVLIGPWAEPWILTTAETVAAVEVLVAAWDSGKRKCTKDQVLTGFAGARTVPERFRHDPRWAIYIRGADGNQRPRLWELNIGQPDYKTAETDPDSVDSTPPGSLETAETIA